MECLSAGVEREDIIRHYPGRPLNQNMLPQWRRRYREMWEQVYVEKKDSLFGSVGKVIRLMRPVKNEQEELFVPREWIDPSFINEVLKVRQLTPVETRAAVSHFNPRYRDEIVRKQKLSPEQLALFLSNIEFSSKDVYDLIPNQRAGFLEVELGSQRRLGVTDEEIDEALKLAKEIFNGRGIFYDQQTESVCPKSPMRSTI